MFDWDNKTAIEKVLFFDNFYQNVDVETVVADDLVSFLENVFKTSPDVFLKERALYYLSGLLLTKDTTNPYKAIALLLDIKPTDEEFLIVQTIISFPIPFKGTICSYSVNYRGLSESSKCRNYIRGQFSLRVDGIGKYYPYS